MIDGRMVFRLIGLEEISKEEIVEDRLIAYSKVNMMLYVQEICWRSPVGFIDKVLLEAHRLCTPLLSTCPHTGS